MDNDLIKERQRQFDQIRYYKKEIEDIKKVIAFGEQIKFETERLAEDKRSDADRYSEKLNEIIDLLIVCENKSKQGPIKTAISELIDFKENYFERLRDTMTRISNCLK